MIRCEEAVRSSIDDDDDFILTSCNFTITSSSSYLSIMSMTTMTTLERFTLENIAVVRLTV